ncbi:uncharacterized protein A4U43_C04F23210 [Asparagus officinalis]|uniref:Uncharacterized protein n=1 Tax=Asparagus officinalis TaxID=4686 RepID=A0A5P1F344_ASPOF|nr:uncharacterized protein A4U43_C04F23210 [Asparagus officinalis]
MSNRSHRPMRTVLLSSGTVINCPHRPIMRFIEELALPIGLSGPLSSSSRWSPCSNLTTTPLEARELISESVLRLSSQREIAHFYCDLVVAVSEKGLDEMGQLGFQLSVFEYRVMIQGYGWLGSFKEMRRVIGRMEDAEIGIDTIRNKRVLGIGYSVRTCNSVLISYPSVVSMVKDLGTLPLSLNDLLEILKDEEALLVKELAGTSVLLEKLTWSDSEGKLDLHGFHLTSTYIILLQWMEEFRCKVKG